MIQAEHLSYRFARGFAIEDLSLSLTPGQLHCLLGPNGCGKSTLLRLLCGELTPTHGTVLLDNKPLAQYSRKTLAQFLAVRWQEAPEPLPMPCLDLVLLGRTPHLGFLGIPREADLAAVRDAMALTDTLAFADAPFHTLSGGEKQRVLLARALASQPVYLLLDEAFSAMDVRQCIRAMQMLKRWVREKNATALLILHDLNLAYAWADRVYFMQNGRIASQGTPEEAFAPEAVQAVFGVTCRPVPGEGLLIAKGTKELP